MRTTIDLPDDLFREVKATAASRGQKMKEFIASALRGALQSPAGRGPDEPSPEEAHRARMLRHFHAMAEGRIQTAPLGKTDRTALHERHV